MPLNIGVYEKKQSHAIYGSNKEQQKCINQPILMKPLTINI